MSCNRRVALRPQVGWHTVYQKTRTGLLFLPTELLYVDICPQLSKQHRKKMVYPRLSSLKLSLSVSHLSLIHTCTCTHSSNTTPNPSLFFVARNVRMDVLHSDGEMMTMAHYPLPEEWIRYIQRQYVLISRQTGYRGPSANQWDPFASHTVTLKRRVNIHTVSSVELQHGRMFEKKCMCPTNAQKLN